MVIFTRLSPSNLRVITHSQDPLNCLHEYYHPGSTVSCCRKYSKSFVCAPEHNHFLPFTGDLLSLTVYDPSGRIIAKPRRRFSLREGHRISRG